MIDPFLPQRFDPHLQKEIPYWKKRGGVNSPSFYCLPEYFLCKPEELFILPLSVKANKQYFFSCGVEHAKGI